MSKEWDAYMAVIRRRNALIYSLKEQGWTDKRIAAHVNLSQGRVNQILMRHRYSPQISPQPDRDW